MDRLIQNLKAIHGLRTALDKAFGSDFVAEVTRLETELQRHYDATLDDPSLVQRRYMLAKMLSNLQEIGRLLAVEQRQAQALDLFNSQPNPTPSVAE